MQITADSSFRERLLTEEINVIDEFAVSANKKSTDEKQKVQEYYGESYVNEEFIFARRETNQATLFSLRPWKTECRGC